MTAYEDIPQVNKLHTEQQQVRSAIDMIDGGGTVAAFTVAPPPAPPFDPTDPHAKFSPPAMAVNITGVTSSPETMSTIRAQLVERDSAITAELASLGVTGSSTKKK